MTIETSTPILRRVLPPSAAPRFVAYAGFVTRAMAMVVDLLIIGAVWLVGGIAVDFIRRTSSVDALLRLIFDTFDVLIPASTPLFRTALEFLTLQAWSFVYFTFFFRFGGATLGKYLMGLRVVRHDGQPLTLARAALRSLAYLASMLPVYVGFLNILVDDRRRGWHDLLVGTVVVHSWRDYPAATEGSESTIPT